MSVMMLGLSLAAGSTFDSQAWGIIVLALISTVASIYQKYKKKQEAREKTGQVPTSKAESAAQPAPPPQLPPLGARKTPMPRSAPRPTMPRIEMPPPRIEAPGMRVERIPQPAPRVPVARGAAATRDASRPAREPQPARPPPTQTAAPPASVSARAAKPGDRPASGAPVRTQIADLLHNRSGLQSAIVLSEIFSPPLALRDEQ